MIFACGHVWKPSSVFPWEGHPHAKGPEDARRWKTTRHMSQTDGESIEKTRDLFKVSWNKAKTLYELRMRWNQNYPRLEDIATGFQVTLFVYES